MSDLRFTQLVVLFSAVFGAGISVLFLYYPQLDIQLAASLFSTDTGFTYTKFSTMNILRNGFIAGGLVWYAVMIFMLISSNMKQIPMLGIGPVEWLYMGLVSVLGPLIFTNLILKDYWGRARPRELIEFGGELEFSPAYYISDQCVDNCSFVSGETSSMVMIFIALAFVLKTRRTLFVGLTLIMGAISGYLRMAQGGHFASDVLLAGVFMALIAAGAYWVMFLRPNVKRV